MLSCRNEMHGSIFRLFFDISFSYLVKKSVLMYNKLVEVCLLHKNRCKVNMELRNMKQEVQYLFEIIKYILNNKTGEIAVPTEDMDWDALYKLAQSHSILNLVHYGVECLPPEHRPDEQMCKILYQSSVNAIVRNYNQIEGVDELFRKFEEEGIYALAVKGICTKKYYPQTDMRTMGDVDLLYKSEQDAQVKKAMRELEYDRTVEGRKHDIYSRRPYMAMEMHRELVSADSIYSSYYENVWERVESKEGYQYIKELSIEDEYIYTIVHLARHFQDGGIGIRFVMDVYVYNHIKDMDWSYIETELKELKLWEFFGKISRLAEMWFGNDIKVEENNSLYAELTTYIISNGTFGSSKNAAAISAVKKGRFQTLWSAIFPSFKSMKSMFVWLDKWPILLPYAWVLRGLRSITSKQRRMNIKYHVDNYKNSDKEYGEKLRTFFETCGL